MDETKVHVALIQNNFDWTDAGNSMFQLFTGITSTSYFLTHITIYLLLYSNEVFAIFISFCKFEMKII